MGPKSLPRGHPGHESGGAEERVQITHPTPDLEPSVSVLGQSPGQHPLQMQSCMSKMAPGHSPGPLGSVTCAQAVDFLCCLRIPQPHLAQALVSDYSLSPAH